ncbi:hypothetical protein C8F01DRAFT_1174893 [Mycena amicta]|nr:hypothetical protein C8F01DRAFT_1174893 [Mycena amicta]
MSPSLTATASVFTVILLTVVAASPSSGHAGAGRGLRIRNAQSPRVEPFGIIPGLLELRGPGTLGLKRADSSGCPIGGTACSDGGGCCGVAQRCCSGGGCCQISESCVTVDGMKGCCPVGATCTASSSHASASATSTRTYSVLTALPTPSASTHDVAVNISALSFIGNWSTAASSCDSNTMAQVVSSDIVSADEYSSASYTFKGSAIFLKLSSINAHYIIHLDTDSTEYGGTPFGETAPLLPPNCTFGWWRDGLDPTISHDLLIVVYGGGNETATDKGKPWVVELQTLEVTQSGAAVSGSSSGSANPSATATSSSNSASPETIQKRGLVYLYGAAIILGGALLSYW